MCCLQIQFSFAAFCQRPFNQIDPSGNLSIAVMVVVSFSPVVASVLLRKNKTVDPPDYLGMGIFLAWLATILLRSYSIIWRWAGQPPWLTDSDILSYSLFVQFSAGVLHLAAPGAIENRVPPRRWIKIGIAVGLAVLLSLAFGYFFDALAVDLIRQAR